MDQRPSAEDESILESPTDLDVILGRGNGVNLHPGNVAFRKVTASRAAQYANTDRRDHKDVIARQIMLEIHRKGGRFLRAAIIPHAGGDGAEWRVVAEPKAVAKVKQALRDAALSLKRNRNTSRQPDFSTLSETAQDTGFDDQSFPCKQGEGLTPITTSLGGHMGGSSFMELSPMPDMRKQVGPDYAYTGQRAEYQRRYENPTGDSTSTATQQRSTSVRKTHSTAIGTGEANIEDFGGRKQQPISIVSTLGSDRQTHQIPGSRLFDKTPGSAPGPAQTAAFLSPSTTIDISSKQHMANQKRRKMTGSKEIGFSADDGQQPRSTKKKNPPGAQSNYKDRDDTR